MNKKLSIKVQKISSHLPLSASAFSNAVVINPEDTTALLKKGSLYAIFDVKANSEFDVLLTTKIINDILHDSYFMSEMTSPIQALEKAVLDVKEKIVNLATHSFGNTDFNIIVAVLWGNVVYIVQYGKAKSYLVRDGTISPINSSSEGYFCEPASAASVAGLLKLGRLGKAPRGVTVCVLTGNGLKDPGITARFAPKILRVKAGGAIKL